VRRFVGDLRAKEREANAFAAELLMPATPVLQLIGHREPSLALIDQIAEACRTSLTASAYRFTGLTTYAVALVWSRANRMVWARRSEEFGGSLRLREQLDSRTFAADLFRGAVVPPGAHEVPADAWLERAAPGTNLLEESRFLPNYDAVLTLLWAKELAVTDDDDEELLESLDPSDFSIRRRRWPTNRR
jgi:IrrE N-terminal-like domain